MRLLNVGASRARGKLIIVANLGFLESRHATTSPARLLLDLARGVGAPTVDAAEMLDTPGREVELVRHGSWDKAITTAVEHGERLAIDISIPTSEFAGSWLTNVADRVSADGAATVVRAPTPVALTLEDTLADLRLRTLGAAPLAFVGDETLVVGSTRVDGPAVCIASSAVVAAVRRLVLPAG
jgi:hypothetical protein